jgi:prolyl-tRNA synthetase
VHSDARGIIWPESVAPFKVHLLGLDMDDASVARHAKKIYSQLQKRRVEALFDDRKKSPGEKFGDADLLGIPYRVVVSKKTGGRVEVKKRDNPSIKLVSQSALLKLLK